MIKVAVLPLSADSPHVSVEIRVDGPFKIRTSRWISDVPSKVVSLGTMTCGYRTSRPVMALPVITARSTVTARPAARTAELAAVSR